jgi:hypothetical protein
MLSKKRGPVCYKFLIPANPSNKVNEARQQLAYVGQSSGHAQIA